jgi:hypothetical protein
MKPSPATQLLGLMLAAAIGATLAITLFVGWSGGFRCPC